VAKQSRIDPDSPRRRRQAPLITPSDLGPEATRDIGGGINAILADVFALYLKTKNLHWHMSGPHFRDYHLLLDEQADQLYAHPDPTSSCQGVRNAKNVRFQSSSFLRSCSGNCYCEPAGSFQFSFFTKEYSYERSCTAEGQ
jgi:hypothetical protein